MKEEEVIDLEGKLQKVGLFFRSCLKLFFGKFVGCGFLFNNGKIWTGLSRKLQVNDVQSLW